MTRNIKRDGHTHTHYCMHGSGEDTEEFIIRAIQLGFEMYSVTEHLPYPESYLQQICYSPEYKAQLRIRDNDFDSYIRDMQRLKKKYKDRIQLLVGAEIDFLPEDTAYTKAMLKDYGPFLDDSLLSVHFIEGKGGWRAVDDSPDDLEAGLIGYYGAFEQVKLAYYRTVKEALLADLGPNKPKRVGHLTLCNKYRQYFMHGNGDAVGAEEKKAVYGILEHMRRHGYSIDLNVAGLFREHCRETYPPAWIISICKEMGIPLVYGSDAHSVADVGRGYQVYQDLIKAVPSKG